MKTRIIRLNDIVIDAGTQQREKINDEVVAEYSEFVKCGDKFPPVTVFFNGIDYYLADGFHRYFANKHADIEEIEADIFEGTKRDAKFYSLGANKSHGLRRSNQDKKKAVLEMITDSEWGELPSRDIGNHIGVSHAYVNKMRRGLEENSEENLGNVSKISPKPASILEVDSKLSTGIEENNQEYDEKEQIIHELKDTVVSLDEENTRLKDAIASGKLPEDEIQSAAEIIVDLRAQVKSLEAELDAVKSSRDSYMVENAELKKQCSSQRNQLKKIGADK